MLLCFQIVALPLFGEDKDKCPGGDQDKPKTQKPSTKKGKKARASIVASGDPNELHGPAGYDSLQWVSINDVLHYTILFENAEEIAGASAQIIFLRFTFPYPEMMNTFLLGEYNFALHNYPIASRGNAYKTRIDLRDSMQIYVDVVAGLDLEKQQAYWHFSSIDPITGIAPWQYDRGLLPVNDSTHVGEGYVTFSMQPPSTLRTGDTISLYADILFDQNDTIPTNRWCNRVDAGAPQSTVLCTPDAETPLLYHLSFTANDDEGGCGVSHLILYQTDNMGTWQEVATLPPDTTIDMQLELGESYRLISIAEDFVGNREPFKTTPDLILNANLPPTDILLSDSVFRDDLPDSAYIATLTSVDTEEGTFTYALAEGDGAIHNDFFLINGDRLLLRHSLRCTDDVLYRIRLSTTDEGGMSFSKPFNLYLSQVLLRPENDTVRATICVGDAYPFRDTAYTQAGTYYHSVANAEMCDSLIVLQLTVLPYPLRPTVSVAPDGALVSSADEGNEWMYCGQTNDSLVSTDSRFIPAQCGKYYVLVNNGACYSDPSDTMVVQPRRDSASLALVFEEGWNWFSSYLDDDRNTNVQTFLQPFQESVEELRPAVATLMPEHSYKIRTRQSVQHTWQGLACNPNDYPVSLLQGWNRVGYPLTYTTSLTNTWSDFLPQEGDIIKTYEAFSIFFGGRWIGTLRTLSPGDGIMYYAQSARTMHFSDDSVHLEVRPLRIARDADDLPLTFALHSYPDNNPMIADLYTCKNELVPEGLYTLLAYVGEECIGIGSYVDQKIYMLMYGDEGNTSPVHFRAYNHLTQQMVDVFEQFTFSLDPLGTPAEPVQLHLDTWIGTDADYVYTDNRYSIYPNPVRDVLYISGNTDAIQTIRIYTLTGKIVKTLDAYPAMGVPVKDLPDASYLVNIETTDGLQHIRKIIKRDLSPTSALK